MTDFILSLSHVSAAYSGREVVTDISFEIARGEILSLAGPNGCGKSTLLKVASGQMKPSSGDISLCGRAIAGIPIKERALIVSVLPQVRSIPEITVERLVMHGRFPHLGMSRRPGKEDYDKVEAAIELTGISEFRNRDIRELSGGERQRVYIAMAVAQDTELIFLDEPTTFLDPGHQFEILELIKRLNRQGKTIVAVLHDLPQALSYSDRVAVMNEGKLLRLGTPSEIFDSAVFDTLFGITGHRTVDGASEAYYFTKRR